MAKNSFVSLFYDETVTLKPTETYSVIKPRQVEPWDTQHFVDKAM